MAGEGEDFLYFPTASIAMDAGDFEQVTNFKVALSNEGKVVKTKRRGVAGVVRGKPSVSITFTAAIDEDGAEHNWDRLVERGTIKQIRVKAPGGDTRVYDVMFTNADYTSPLEDADTYDITAVGRKVPS